MLILKFTFYIRNILACFINNLLNELLSDSFRKKICNFKAKHIIKMFKVFIDKVSSY